MREVSAVQSSKWLKLTDVLSKPLLVFSPMVSTKLVGRHKAQCCDEQPDSVSQQSNKDEQSTAMG